MSDYCLELEAENTKFAKHIQQFIADWKYICGIPVRGGEPPIADTQTGPQYILAYVKKLEAEIAKLRATLEQIERHAPIMGSTGDYRQGQLDILEIVSTLASLTLAAKIREAKP